MAKCKTESSPLLTHWRYCSRGPNNRYRDKWIEKVPFCRRTPRVGPKIMSQCVRSSYKNHYYHIYMHIVGHQIHWGIIAHDVLCNTQLIWPIAALGIMFIIRSDNGLPPIPQLPKPMSTFCQSDPWETTAVEIRPIFSIFCYLSHSFIYTT